MDLYNLQPTTNGTNLISDTIVGIILDKFVLSFKNDNTQATVRILLRQLSQFSPEGNNDDNKRVLNNNQHRPNQERSNVPKNQPHLAQEMDRFLGFVVLRSGRHTSFHQRPSSSRFVGDLSRLGRCPRTRLRPLRLPLLLVVIHFATSTFQVRRKQLLQRIQRSMERTP